MGLQSSPPGTWWWRGSLRSLRPALVVAVVGKTPGGPGEPRNGECAGRVQRREERLVGTGGFGTELSRFSFGVCGSESPGGVAQRGCGGSCRYPGRPAPSLPRCPPSPNVPGQLCPPHRFSPDGAVTMGGHQGTVVTRSAGFVRGSSCGLWRPQSSLFPQGSHFLLSFPNVWEAGCQIHDSVPLPYLFL